MTAIRVQLRRDTWSESNGPLSREKRQKRAARAEISGSRNTITSRATTSATCKGRRFAQAERACARGAAAFTAAGADSARSNCLSRSRQIFVRYASEGARDSSAFANSLWRRSRAALVRRRKSSSLPPVRAVSAALHCEIKPWAAPVPPAVEIQRPSQSESPSKARRHSHGVIRPCIVMLPKTAARIVGDRKSTRLNSSHLVISYAVFCLKKKKKKIAS